MFENTAAAPCLARTESERELALAESGEWSGGGKAARRRWRLDKNNNNGAAGGKI